MNRLKLFAILGAVAAVAACSDPAPQDHEGLEPTAEEPVAPLPEEVPPPETAPVAPTAPADNSTLPPDSRSSEQTVQPESETLFY